MVPIKLPDTSKTKSIAPMKAFVTPSSGPVVPKPVRSFKAGIDAMDARRRRGETGVELRKNKRDAAISKKRMAIQTAGGETREAVAILEKPTIAKQTETKTATGDAGVVASVG